jgi:exodeoxyribonuclease V alpha subunit
MAWIDVSQTRGLTDLQRKQLEIATSGDKVGILTGIPGSGKTYTLAAFLSVWQRQNTGGVQILAPTGKAAVRATEAMLANGHNLAATTIHRGLLPQQNGHVAEEWSFSKGKHSPFDESLIVIDECSMIPSRLMADVLEAVKPSARVLLIGDPDQLPPIGAGRPFLDMIDAGIPTGVLNEPHRYSGRIGAVCKAIRAGDPFAPSAEIDLDAEFPENYRHIERATAPYQVKTVLDLLERVWLRGFDPVNDVQVLVATNDKSPVSRVEMNKAMRRELNSPENAIDDCQFWLRDKVICLRNGLKRADMDDWEEAGWNAQYIANGEQGVIVGVEENLNKKKGFKPRWVAVQFDQDRRVRFWRQEWSHLDLGYAITTHKAQGSGFPVVIYVIDDSGAAKRVCSRSHVYTAMSRPQRLLFTVGKKSVLDAHIRRLDLAHRKTFLAERIRGEWTHNCTFFPTRSSSTSTSRHRGDLRE